MNFNSFTYATFLILVVMFYFVLPQRHRWKLLLTASYYFYMSWNAMYAILLVFSTVVDYAAAIYIERTPSRLLKKVFLSLSLFSNLGLLFAFKYYDFAAYSLERASMWFGTSLQMPYLEVLLPVGISFYTFQSLSYTIDVYREQRKAEYHLGIFALYVSFFPQLVAGPIERSTTLLPQFRENHRFSSAAIASGMKLIIWGLFKKVVISDRLSEFVDRAYALPWEQDGLVFLVGTYFFAIQIYCDFSGYSDIAIGSARLMGYDLMINFRRPYFATSLSDFWRKWHVSLSTWFRDYLYFPLGGSRVSFARACANIMTVFVVSGIWHGARWTFIIWGFIHGLILVAERVVARGRHIQTVRWLTSSDSGWKLFGRRLITFHVVILAWIFFRAAYVQDAVNMVKRILLDVPSFRWETLATVQALPTVIGEFLLILFLFVVEWFARTDDFSHIMSSRPRWQRWVFFYVLIMLLLLAGKYDGKAFIYFQF